MPADLTAIRALLASVQGFTPGPWMAHKWSLDSAEHVASEIAQAARNSGGSDLHAAIKQIGDAEWIYPAFTGNGPTSGPNACLIAAAPTLHAHLTELVGEVERLRLVVGWAETDALGTSNALALVTEQAKRDCAERDAELERLRAHNARMAANITERADAHRYMAEACPDDPTFLATAAELDALAAGEAPNV